MLVFVLRESVFHLLPGWTIRFRASVVTSRERGRFDVLLTVFPPLESVFDVVFDHTLLLLLVLMIATLLLFLLSFSLSRVRNPRRAARARKTIGWEMGDAVCSRRERKRPTNATDEEREEEKKVSQKSGNRKTNRRWFFFLHFFPPLSCLLSSPSEVLRFLFEGKTSFFVVVLCITVLRDIKTPL